MSTKNGVSSNFYMSEGYYDRILATQCWWYFREMAGAVYLDAVKFNGQVTFTAPSSGTGTHC